MGVLGLSGLYGRITGGRMISKEYLDSVERMQGILMDLPWVNEGDQPISLPEIVAEMRKQKAKLTMGLK